MKKNLVLLLLMLPALAWCQNYSTTNAKAIKLFEKGQQALYQGKGDEALKSFEQALAVDPDFVEANILMAEWYLDGKQSEKAKEHYYAAVRSNPTFFTLAWLQLGALELQSGSWDKAKECYEKYLQLDKKNKDRHPEAENGLATIEFRRNALAHPVAFNPQNLGENINSRDDEYLPALTVDGQTLIFTRRFPRTPNTIASSQEEEDFYTSTFTNGQWTAAERMKEPVNSYDNEGAQCISQDGRIMFFTACGRRDGAGRCDIYMCTRKGDKWSAPRNLGTPVNTGAWESQPSFSIDGKTLYFVSNRKGGYGGMDIWKTVYGEGGWSAPENLGPEINTAGDEMSPFIHYDDQTLYFSSNGHVGMGGMDLYCARKQQDGTWTRPVNLGYPINTEGDESNMIVTADGTKAYFSSDREGGMGRQDLYSFDLPVPVRPLLTLWMKGTVKDEMTNGFVSAQLQVIDLATGEVVATTSSDSQTGHYLISLPIKKDYALHASAKGYLFHSQNVPLSMEQDISSAKPFEVNISMRKMESGTKIALRNVFFATGKYELLESSQVELNKVVEVLRNNPTMRVELEGHTDNVGADSDNQKLSENRAKAVFDYLVSQGIPESRLSYKGYGATQPVSDNATEEGRSQNRRTEMRIL